MLEFIVDNYLIVLIIAFFLIFALIGYIVDSIRNKRREEATKQVLETNEEIPSLIEVEEEIEIEEVPEIIVEETINVEEEPIIPPEIEEPVAQTVKETIPEIEEPEE